MSREVTVELPFEIPRTSRSQTAFHYWLLSMAPQMGVWGKDGREVGVGFTWYTRTGFDNRKLYLETRHMKRALKNAHIISGGCDPYNLEQRIVYIRDGDGYGTLTLKEGS